MTCKEEGKEKGEIERVEDVQRGVRERREREGGRYVEEMSEESDNGRGEAYLFSVSVDRIGVVSLVVCPLAY